MCWSASEDRRSKCLCSVGTSRATHLCRDSAFSAAPWLARKRVREALSSPWCRRRPARMRTLTLCPVSCSDIARLGP